MPKRVPTPEPGDDEPRVLIVNQPYPLHANWLVPEECRDFGRWIACCMQPGEEGSFIAFFHKPSSAGQVLLEISREWPYYERLLGQHSWDEFLKKPVETHQGLKTKVFYSTYNSVRAAQKDGWKRVDVSDWWFQRWDARSCPDIKYPYPATSWCPPPPEDRTNKPLCRPLPGTLFSAQSRLEVPAPAPAVPGSVQWESQRFIQGNMPRGRGRGRGGRGGLQQKHQVERNIPSNSNAPWHHATFPTTRSIFPTSPRSPSFIPPNETSTSASMRHISHTLSPGPSETSFVDGDEDELEYIADWEQTSTTDDDAMSTTSRSYTRSPEPGAYAPYVTSDSNWPGIRDLDGRPSEDHLDRDALTAKCSVPGHGRTCKKGICEERKKMVRKQERDRAEQEKRQAKANAKASKDKSNTNANGTKTSKSANNTRTTIRGLEQDTTYVPPPLRARSESSDFGGESVSASVGSGSDTERETERPATPVVADKDQEENPQENGAGKARKAKVAWGTTRKSKVANTTGAANPKPEEPQPSAEQINGKKAKIAWTTPSKAKATPTPSPNAAGPPAKESGPIAVPEVVATVPPSSTGDTANARVFDWAADVEESMSFPDNDAAGAAAEAPAVRSRKRGKGKGKKAPQPQSPNTNTNTSNAPPGSASWRSNWD
ncbi:hypothetical protein MKEN_00712300 [Mycena kentingensis (nom. inval.)]|nr:hypothetical protein MKEN_00712300 [Mycena kentingensis (nom. inval.)]